MNRSDDEEIGDASVVMHSYEIDRIQLELNELAQNLGRPHASEEKLEIQAFRMDDIVKKRRPKKKKAAPKPPDGSQPVEVDFYKNPTILSRLILNQKYESAVVRLRRNPEEASVWVCAKRGHRTKSYTRHVVLATRKTSDVVPYSIRQLPLHIACNNLKRALDMNMRATLNELITNLVVAYPQSCKEKDHTGSLPLHIALWEGAAPETLSMFLMAYPESVNSLDQTGRSLSELNRYRSGDKKKQVDEILSLEPDFWAEAHQEATLRLKHEEIHWPSTGDVDVSSTAVLASSLAGIESLPTMPGEESQPKLQRSIVSEEIEPIAWEQLEERAILLEQVLAEVNENNFMLNQRIEGLVQSKLKFIDQLDQLGQTNVVRQAHALQRDNKKLKRKVAKLEEIIRVSKDVPLDPEDRKRRREPSASPPRAGRESDNTTLIVENDTLRKHYKELNLVYHQQKAKLHRLEEVVKSLVAEDATREKKTSGSTKSSLVSSLSGPTTDRSQDEYTMDGVDSLDRLQPPLKKKADIAWHPPHVLATELSDSLSVIFRHAASGATLPSLQQQSTKPTTDSPVSRSRVRQAIPKSSVHDVDIEIPALSDE